MPITMRWFDEARTIILVQNVGEIKGNDFLDSIAPFQALLLSVSHPVDVIYDQSRQVNFTANYMEVAIKVHKVRYPNLRLAVFINKGLGWELFILFARQFKRIPYRFARAGSLDEAQEIIQRFRREQVITPPPPSTTYLN